MRAGGFLDQDRAPFDLHGGVFLFCRPVRSCYPIRFRTSLVFNLILTVSAAESGESPSYGRNWTPCPERSTIPIRRAFNLLGGTKPHTNVTSNSRIPSPNPCPTTSGSTHSKYGDPNGSFQTAGTFTRARNEIPTHSRFSTVSRAGQARRNGLQPCHFWPHSAQRRAARACARPPGAHCARTLRKARGGYLSLVLVVTVRWPVFSEPHQRGGK